MVGKASYYRDKKQTGALSDAGFVDCCDCSKYHHLFLNKAAVKCENSRLTAALSRLISYELQHC